MNKERLIFRVFNSQFLELKKSKLKYLGYTKSIKYTFNFQITCNSQEDFVKYLRFSKSRNSLFQLFMLFCSFGESQWNILSFKKLFNLLNFWVEEEFNSVIYSLLLCEMAAKARLNFLCFCVQNIIFFIVWTIARLFIELLNLMIEEILWKIKELLHINSKFWDFKNHELFNLSFWALTSRDNFNSVFGTLAIWKKLNLIF